MQLTLSAGLSQSSIWRGAVGIFSRCSKCEWLKKVAVKHKTPVANTTRKDLTIFSLIVRRFSGVARCNVTSWRINSIIFSAVVWFSIVQQRCYHCPRPFRYFGTGTVIYSGRWRNQSSPSSKLFYSRILH